MKVLSLNKEALDAEPFVLPIDPNRDISEDNYVYTIYTYAIGVPISPETSYEVYSVIVFRNRVYFLIDNGENGIKFVPSEMFVIEDESVNDDWRLFLYDIGGETMCALGPKCFAGKYDYIIGIMKKDKLIMGKYLEYKKYLREWGISPEL